jgi:hypothetical protein
LAKRGSSALFKPMEICPRIFGMPNFPSNFKDNLCKSYLDVTTQHWHLFPCQTCGEIILLGTLARLLLYPIGELIGIHLQSLTFYLENTYENKVLSEKVRKLLIICQYEYVL